MILLAMIPENPVVGGTVLRRAAIQSPNFATGSTGWSINQDGSAEFNNLVIRNGQIVSGTALYYSSSPPALGNLVASVAAAAGSDTPGNAYLSGVTTYTNLGGTFFAVSLEGGACGLWSAPGAGGPWTAAGTFQMLGGGTPDIYIQAITGNLLLQAPTAGKFIALQRQTTIQDTVTANPVLDVTNQGSATPPILRVTAAALADLLFGGRVSGDTNARIVIDTTAGGATRIRLGPGSAGPDTVLSRPSANLLQLLTADLDIATAGRGLQIKEGTNARMGTAVLGGGTGQALVSNTSVTANTRIFLTNINPGGTVGFLHVGGIVAGSSFSIISSNAADTSTIAWLLIEPG